MVYGCFTMKIDVSPVKVLDNQDKIATEMLLLVMCPDASQAFQKKSILKYNWWKGV